MSNLCYITPAFEVSDKPFFSEIPTDTPIGQIFSEGYTFKEDPDVETHFGWLDLVKLKHIVSTNNISSIYIQNLDVLGRAAKYNHHCVSVCQAYICDHHILHDIPKTKYKDYKPFYQIISYGDWDFDENTVEDIPLNAQWFLRSLLLRLKVKEIIYMATKVAVKAFYDNDGNIKLMQYNI